MTLLKIILISIFSFFALTLFSQQTSESTITNHEIGLRFSGFDDFNLMYKKGLAENKYRRHRFLNARFQFGGTGNKEFAASIGYAIGTEKRKNITKDLHFIHGPEIAFSLSYRDSPTDFLRFRSINMVPSIGYILGFLLEISDSFYISAEVIPALSSSILLRNSGSNSYNLDLGGSTNGTGLNLMYRFSK